MHANAINDRSTYLLLFHCSWRSAWRGDRSAAMPLTTRSLGRGRSTPGAAASSSGCRRAKPDGTSSCSSSLAAPTALPPAPAPPDRPPALATCCLQRRSSPPSPDSMRLRVSDDYISTSAALVPSRKSE
jgi:hypothetical protein